MITYALNSNLCFLTPCVDSQHIVHVLFQNDVTFAVFFNETVAKTSYSSPISLFQAMV